MVEKAKMIRPKPTTKSPSPGTPILKAIWDSSAPVSPLLQAPVMMIKRAVRVQTQMVSMKVPSIPTTPCRTGSWVRAAAWAMGALPSPASLENTPRATPNRRTWAMAAPVNPPVAAVPVNASVKIMPKADATCSMFKPMMIRAPTT